MKQFLFPFDSVHFQEIHWNFQQPRHCTRNPTLLQTGKKQKRLPRVK